MRPFCSWKASSRNWYLGENGWLSWESIPVKSSHLTRGVNKKHKWRVNITANLCAVICCDAERVAIYLCSLCSSSWQSRHVRVSQVSQKSFSGSCLWMGQKTGLCPDETTVSGQKGGEFRSDANTSVCLEVESWQSSRRCIWSGPRSNRARVASKWGALQHTVAMATVYWQHRRTVCVCGLEAGGDQPSYQTCRRHPPWCGFCGPWWSWPSGGPLRRSCTATHCTPRRSLSSPRCPRNSYTPLEKNLYVDNMLPSRIY